MSDTHITEAELRAEYEKLDMLRGRTHARLLTDEQFQLLSYARTHDARPVSWAKLVEYL